jgi:hypothetical protein
LIILLFLFPLTSIAQPRDKEEETINEVHTDFSSLIGETKPIPSTLCNCYLYVRTKIAGLPNTATIINNLSDNGPVAVFYYPDSGLYHFTLVKKETGSEIFIEETNYKPCQYGERTVSKSDPSLVGFFNPHQ